jgi:hypothetical protein
LGTLYGLSPIIPTVHCGCDAAFSSTAMGFFSFEKNAVPLDNAGHRDRDYVTDKNQTISVF